MIVAGGDIVRSPHGLTIHITALGESRGDRVLTRAGAAPGDIVAVSGTLGASAAGMRLFQMGPDDLRRRARTADHLIAAHVRPEPRVGLAKVLLEAGATSAMDLSDGLLGDLPKIAEASGVSVEIDARRVPVAASVRALFPEEWLELALRGGEDYELLFTTPRDAWINLELAAAQAGDSITAIGTIVPTGEEGPAIHIVDLHGVRQAISVGAFDHFLAQ
jgi:thiamine-monophosphate kinase